MMQRLRIGQLAKRTGVRAKTIRYYEQIGLLPKVPRDSSGYRRYPETEIARLRLVSRSKLLGLSLGEIKEIVGYIADGHCDAVQTRLTALISEKLDEIDAKISELALLKEDLLLYQNRLEQRPQTGLQPVDRKSIADCSCIGEEDTHVRDQAGQGLSRHLVPVAGEDINLKEGRYLNGQQGQETDKQQERRQELRLRLHGGQEVV